MGLGYGSDGDSQADSGSSRQTDTKPARQAESRQAESKSLHQAGSKPTVVKSEPSNANFEVTAGEDDLSSKAIEGGWVKEEEEHQEEELKPEPSFVKGQRCECSSSKNIH